MRGDSAIEFLPKHTEKYNVYQLYFDIVSDTPNCLVVFSDKSEEIFPNRSSYQDSVLHLSMDKGFPAVCTLYLNREYTFMGLEYVGKAFTNTYLEFVFEVQYEL